ncbi:uncharacterized protein LOC129914063 isoform X2 [Episyrphus balteatus]|uniref:uncharacterized protein LOC129914063 isoform X2 n=1 Tax=Episyrphus balteatus TaxID=286459 RepID=UPI002485380E|nr:uncharacterized protein LOC129914063 isoform X2 [Episyrphus balteatus]
MGFNNATNTGCKASSSLVITRIVFFCEKDKIVIPEQIAIQLVNSSEISAEQFYKNLHEYYQRHHNQYLWNKDATTTHQNLQNSPVNKTPKENDFVQQHQQQQQQQTEVPSSLTSHHGPSYQFIQQKEANEVALLESLSIASQETHSATAPPINEKPSNYDDEDYSEDDSNLGVESSGFFPFNFDYTNRRKFDAD